MQEPQQVPDLNWTPKRAREFTDRAASLAETFLEKLPDLPVGRAWAHGAVREAMTIPIPRGSLEDEAIFEHLRSVMFDHSVYPGHPRFMGYISGPGTVPGAVGDFLAAIINQNAGGWRLSPAATEIEVRLLRWFADAFGLPASAGGVLLSGGAMGNLTGLKVARDRAATWDVRREGVRAGAPMSIYATEQSHAVITRAADMLGLGRDAIRMVPMDDRFRMRPDALAEAIRRDRAEGIVPMAVAAGAGTTATGSIDPLADIAEVCDGEQVWLHVDAAYGGPAVLAPDLRPLFDGIERADSIAFDPHKWLYTPIAGGCVLFRDISLAKEAFHVEASYTVEDTERTGATFDFGSHGPQWSRPFAALKIWLSLLAHGTDAYSARISHDVGLARYLAAQVEADDEMQLGPTGLSVCCFRYVPAGLDAGDRANEPYLNQLNERLMTDVQLDGRAYCSNAMLDGRAWLRACIVNFRTEAPDVDALLETVRDLGRRAHLELAPLGAPTEIAGA